MPDFSNLGSFRQTLDPRPYPMPRYVLREGAEPVKLWLLPATAANQGYEDALIRHSAERMAAIASKKPKEGEEAEMLRTASQLSREQDHELFGAHCVAQWENVFDSTGEPVELTPENARDFLAAIDVSDFGVIRWFVTTPDNFCGPVIDPVPLAKPQPND